MTVMGVDNKRDGDVCGRGRLQAIGQAPGAKHVSTTKKSERLEGYSSC
jgi:hypothetical protein